MNGVLQRRFDPSIYMDSHSVGKSRRIKDNQFEREKVVNRKHNRPVAGQVAPGTLGDEDFQEYGIEKCV